MKPLFSLKGKVQHGQKRGKDLGFPTINFNLEKPLPQLDEGVYLSQTIVENITYNSLTFMGKAKTFGEKAYKAETYILDFDYEIYNAEVAVNLIKKLRGNVKFNSAEDLVLQMKKDEQDARLYFSLQK